MGKQEANVANYGMTKKLDNYEFGGPVGVLALMIWSHYILIYFWYCLEKNDGSLLIPTSIDSLTFHLQAAWQLILEKGLPSVTTWVIYFLFFFVQLVLASIMPGMMMKGMPTSPHGKRLDYLCNGYSCYYLCLFGALLVHFTGIFNLGFIADHYGEFLLASIIIGDVTSYMWYVYGLWFADEFNGRSSCTGNMIYDFFMGTILYPRFGIVDIKMVAECRWSWTTLMMLTLSCALKQYDQTGTVSTQMMLMLLAHWLYSNATAKGEHCIPCTWDMFHENFGWMLNFWNIAGVPFLYCFQSLYILKNQARITANYHPALTVIDFALLLVGYYVFDTANCQKATIKHNIRRHTFPCPPWSFLEEPIRYIVTPKGNLLVDGWYAYARKMQYSGDIMMALSWGLACGFNSFLPYFYALFFTCMIIHRQTRDEVRCKEKYGEHWDIYTKTVPNVFFPSAAFFNYLMTGERPPDGPHITLFYKDRQEPSASAATTVSSSPAGRKARAQSSAASPPAAVEEPESPVAAVKQRKNAAATPKKTVKIAAPTATSATKIKEENPRSPEKTPSKRVIAMAQSYSDRVTRSGRKV